MLADPALEVRASSADHALYQAYERYPSVVASALVQESNSALRSRSGLTCSCRNNISSPTTIRYEPWPTMRPSTKRVRTNAASIAGPVTIGQLIDALLELDQQAENDSAARQDLEGQRRTRVLASLVLNGPYSSRWPRYSRGLIPPILDASPCLPSCWLRIATKTAPFARLRFWLMCKRPS